MFTLMPVKNKLRKFISFVGQSVSIYFSNIVTVEHSSFFLLLKRSFLQIAGINVQGKFFIDRGFKCLKPENIWIEENVSMGHDNHLWAFAPIRIGRYTQTAKDLLIISGSHDSASFESLANQEVIIGAGCWIGARVTILGGSKIGKGCVIGACSMVKGDIPDWSVAVGIPARVIRQRVPADEIISPFGTYSPNDL